MKKDILLERLRLLDCKPVDELTLHVQHFGPFSYYAGMEFTIPVKLEIFVDSTEHGGFNEFILIHDQYDNWMRFYPSTFCKRVAERDEEGAFTGNVVYAKGTAVDLVQNFLYMKDAINALRGKKLKVTKMEAVRTMRNGRNYLTYVPTIDIIN